MIYDFRLTIYDLTDKVQWDLFYWAKRLKEGKAKSLTVEQKTCLTVSQTVRLQDC